MRDDDGNPVLCRHCGQPVCHRDAEPDPDGPVDRAEPDWPDFTDHVVHRGCVAAVRCARGPLGVPLVDGAGI